MTQKIAVVHGRFQPLHNGHLYDYILEAWKTSNCDYMYIGITNPDIIHTKESKNDLQRSLPESNPLTFIERLEMIKQTILDEGITLNQFDIVPFPINFPELLEKFAPDNAKYYLTIFDEWGDEKAQILERVYGKKNVEILYRRPKEAKTIDATTIRRNIRDGEEWEHLVPKAISKFLKENDLLKRIAEMQTT